MIASRRLLFAGLALAAACTSSGGGSPPPPPPPASVAALTVTGAAPSTVAGAAVGVTVRAVDASGAVVAGYTGTVRFSSSDGLAGLPADYTFAAADAGAHAFTATLKTAGTATVTATDTARPALTANATFSVAPAAAAKLTLAFPAAATSGTAVQGTVTATDAFGNVASTYAGTVHFASSDRLATLPADATFTAGEAGVKGFGATFQTPGAQTLSATDTVQAALTASASVAVAAAPLPGSVTHFGFTGLPASANAGASFGGAVQALDSTNAVVATYRGTVHFTSSDPNAGLPADATFSATDAGSHPISLRLFTPGAQTVTATDTSVGGPSGTSGAVTVHGLVYTDPAAGVQQLRLVRNAASTGATVVLDLVANAPVTGWFVGMDLPLDATKVALNATPIANGNILNVGLSPQPLKAVLPTAGPLASVLVSGASQKAGGAGSVTTDASIASGQVLYTLRLDAASSFAAGTVFDGAALPSKWRAELRNRAGTTIVPTSGFAVGKLEMR